MRRYTVTVFPNKQTIQNRTYFIWQCLLERRLVYFPFDQMSGKSWKSVGKAKVERKRRVVVV